MKPKRACWLKEKKALGFVRVFSVHEEGCGLCASLICHFSFDLAGFCPHIEGQGRQGFLGSENRSCFFEMQDVFLSGQKHILQYKKTKGFSTFGANDETPLVQATQVAKTGAFSFVSPPC